MDNRRRFWKDAAFNMAKLFDITAAAKEKHPPGFEDKLGSGEHGPDAFIKPINTKPARGARVPCKHQGLKLTLTVGAKKRKGLMRRWAVSKDPVVLLNAALQAGAKAAGVELKITDSEIPVTA